MTTNDGDGGPITDAQLLVVVGKGGVGRSTVAAALSVLGAERGRRVLVVDAIADGGLALALGASNRSAAVSSRSSPGGRARSAGSRSRSAGGRARSRSRSRSRSQSRSQSRGGSSRPPTTRSGRIVDLGDRVPGLSLLELNTEAALDEYLRLNLTFPIAPRSLAPLAKLLDYVATAAPAVREILTIGKIGHEVRRGPWDLVVVDAPATGHVVEMLAAPKSLHQLVGFGPLASDTAWLIDLLADQRSQCVAVTLAEELPVTETLALLDRLDQETDTGVAGLIVNRLPAPLTRKGKAEAAKLAAGGGPLSTLAASALHRFRESVEERRRLEPIGLAFEPVEVAEVPDDPTSTVVAALEAGGW